MIDDLIARLRTPDDHSTRALRREAADALAKLQADRSARDLAIAIAVREADWEMIAKMTSPFIADALHRNDLSASERPGHGKRGRRSRRQRLVRHRGLGLGRHTCRVGSDGVWSY